MSCPTSYELEWHAESKDKALPGEMPQQEVWFGIGPGRAVRVMRSGLVVEYSSDYRAAIGVVFMDVGTPPS